MLWPTRQLAQAAVVLDPARRLALARRIVGGRIQSQRTLLKRLARGRKGEDFTAGVTKAAPRLRRMARAAELNPRLDSPAALAALAKTPDAAKQAALKPIADKLLTPPVRYSPPGLDTHVTYLRSQTDGHDGKVGNHPKERYADLRARIDALIAELDKVLGPAQTAAKTVTDTPA